MGKATRVWKAVELRKGSPFGKPVILKDGWRHEELSREGDTLQAIRQLATTSPTHERLSRRLLTVLHHGDVVIRSHSGQNPHIDRTRRHTDNAARFLRNEPPVDSRFTVPDAQGEPCGKPAHVRGMLSGGRVHYRIVFKELCKPLLKQPLETVFSALSDTCEGSRSHYYWGHAVAHSQSSDGNTTR